MPTQSIAASSATKTKTDGHKPEPVPMPVPMPMPVHAPSPQAKPAQIFVPRSSSPAATPATLTEDHYEKPASPDPINPNQPRTNMSLPTPRFIARKVQSVTARPPALATIEEVDNDNDPVPLTPSGKEVGLKHKNRVGELLREILLAADRFEPHGVSNNDPDGLLAAAPRKTLWDDTHQAWLGVSQQFVKDCARQTVWVETIDKQGTLSRRPLGHNGTPATTSSALDAQAKHLLKICSGDLRWRFQASQILNQTLPNGAMSALHSAQGIELQGTGPITFGMSHTTSFTVRRLSHTRLHIAHTSVWQGEQKPFYMDNNGAHRFEGWAKQTVTLSLQRPHETNGLPELHKVRVVLAGFIAPIS